MSYQVRYTRGARDDLVRLYQFLLDHDVDAAERALSAIRQGTEALRTFPFTCRKVEKHNPFLRELVVSFGSSGCQSASNSFQVTASKTFQLATRFSSVSCAV